MAENHVRLPMRMHFKSRSPALNVRRLREVFATDTFFSSEKALGGINMAQLYVGKTSTFTEVYGMKTEANFQKLFKTSLDNGGLHLGYFQILPRVRYQLWSRTFLGSMVSRICNQKLITNIKTMLKGRFRKSKTPSTSSWIE